MDRHFECGRPQRASLAPDYEPIASEGGLAAQREIKSSVGEINCNFKTGRHPAAIDEQLARDR